MSVRSVAALLGLLTAQGLPPALLREVEALADVEACARFGRLFKLDVSLASGPSPRPRFSVNDSGEPEAFRERLRRARWLGLPPELLERFLSLSAPGDGQTTVAVKWEEGGPRVSLYLEELFEHSDPEGVRAALRRFAGLPARSPPLEGGWGSICVDTRAGLPVAFKEYRSFDHALHSALPDPLRRLADRLPPHPVSGRIGVLHCHRWDLQGVLRGHKLMWMPECHTQVEVEHTWRHTARLLRDADLALGPNLRRALRLAQSLHRVGQDLVYPDLVGLDVDPDGALRQALLYVSLT